MTVSYSTRDVSATAGDDYTAASGTLILAPDTTGSITVATRDEMLSEGPEKPELALSLVLPPADVALANSVVTGTIIRREPC